MSDQGHTTDGTTEINPGSPGGHVREHADPDAQTVTNVLQFPRDWFGPIEDLEPIDLNPPANSVELDPPPASIDFDQPASPVSAAAFWDEDAGALHQLVEFPGGEGSDDEEFEPEPGSTTLFGRRSVGTEGSAARRPHPSRTSLALIGLLVLIVAGSALILASGLLHHPAPSTRLSQSLRRRSGPSSTHRHATHSPVRQVTVTTTVTTTRRSPTPRHRGAARPSKSVKPVSIASTKQPDSVRTEGPVSHSQGSPVLHRRGAPVVDHDSSKSVSAAGDSGDTGCVVQSPDSGCLP